MFHAATNTSLTHTHTHTHAHTKKNIEKLVVSFNLSILTIPSAPGAQPESLDFSHGFSWGRMVEDKKEHGF